MSPFEAMYGCPPPPLFYDTNFNPTLKAAADYHDSQKVVINILKLKLDRTKRRMKSQADKGQTDVQFEVGDYILVKLHKYRQNSLAQCCSTKLNC